MLKSRGYNTTAYNGLNTGYSKCPTKLQLASYGKHTEHLIRSNDSDGLRKTLQAGLSPDACDNNGTSLVHLACRLGSKDCLKLLLEFQGSVDTVNNAGQTPLHMACMADELCYKVIDLILKRSRRLFFIADDQGRLPLSRLPKEQWTSCTKYLMSRKEMYWPERCMKNQGFQEHDRLAVKKPRMYPLRQADTISSDLAFQVAQGQLTPMEAINQSSHSRTSSVPDSEDFSESTFDEDEMSEILACIHTSKPVAWISRNETIR